MLKLEDIPSMFGNVYVSNKYNKTTVELAKLRQLVGVRFCNLDHKWYDNKGDIHPFFEKFKGSSFSLQMTHQFTTPGETEEEVSIKLLYPCPVNILPPQDIEHILEEDERLMNILKELELISGEDDNNFKLYGLYRGASVACLLAPGLNIHEMFGLGLFACMCIIYDDFVEDNRRRFGYEQLNQITNAMRNIMNGREFDMKQLKSHFQPEEPGMPFIEKCLGYVSLQHKDMNEKRNLGVNPEHYIQAFLQWFEGIHFEQCVEWLELHDKGSPVYRRAQSSLRHVTSAPYVALEMILYYRGISVEEEIRSSFLFRRFVNLYAEQGSLVQDIFSFSKELANGEVGSSVLLYKADGLSVSEAFQKVVEDCNKVTMEFIEVGDLLVKIHGGKKEIKELVNVVKYALYGHMQWYNYTRRYDPEMVFHCVVEEN